MEDKKFYWVNVVGLIVSVIFFCTTIYLQKQNGYARDEGIYVSEFIGKGLWILIIGCIICGIIFLNVSKIKNGKLSTILSTLTLILLIVFGLTITIGWFISYNQAENIDIQSENISFITLEELQEAIDAEDTQTIYIGSHKNCPLCRHLMPDFQDFIEDAHLDVLYYNITQDRETRPEEMEKVLDSINVHSVPRALMIDNGDIVQIFKGENMVVDMKDYFE